MRLRSIAIALALVSIGAIAAWMLIEQYARKPTANALAVPDGDREIAWFNTSTNGAAWERFVAGIHRISQKVSGLEIDDSHAFLESTTAIPEVVVAFGNRPGKLRFRWYKQTNETSTKHWIDSLGDRDPAPLAIIGGGSSDRARDLARELAERQDWHGSRPLLLITTATAEMVSLLSEGEIVKLTEIYPERTFRFCFTNEQMARAVVDFVWNSPELRPQGGPMPEKAGTPMPRIFRMAWKDDPYSLDLSEELKKAVLAKMDGRAAIWSSFDVPYSVGLFDRANKEEELAARLFLSEIPLENEQRSLLILPTTTTAARRFLREMTGSTPLIGKHLVAVTGDSIGINDVYRDGALLWNIRDVPVPLVFFAHQNPIGWDDELQPPTATDELLLFSRLFEVLIHSAFPPEGEAPSNSDALGVLLRTQRIVPFDHDGNRKEGEEYVVYVRPEISDNGRIGDQAAIEVWRRSRGEKVWRPVETSLPLQAPLSTRTADRLVGGGP